MDSTDIPILPPLDARIPKWSLDRLEFRKCPLCYHENNPLLRRPDRLPITFCANCQLWYVAAIPPSEEIQKLYQGYWFLFRPKDLSHSYATRILSDENLLRDDIRLNCLSALAQGLKGKRLLEIGCGCGEFLIGAKHRGASVFGNDISQEACSFVKKHLGIPVFQGQLSDSAFIHEFGRMDIVVMSDLIEHPVEPLNTFESALSVLQLGGLLLILTPNGGQASDDLQCAKEWVGFRVDLEHLQYLSSATIAVIANRYNCRIEHLETLGYPALEGIDHIPVTTNTKASLKSIIKAQLKKYKLVRNLVQAVRSISNAMPEDPRLGTYYLFTILRKINS